MLVNTGRREHRLLFAKQPTSKINIHLRLSNIQQPAFDYRTYEMNR